MRKKFLVAALCLPFVGCGAIMNATKYKGWEAVRIESQVPSKICIYKMQEACSKPQNLCMDWHKKHAVTFGADTVVITDRTNQAAYSSGVFVARGGQNMSTLADYYYCNGPKNIKPE